MSSLTNRLIDLSQDYIV
jgi:hypothetical protein